VPHDLDDQPGVAFALTFGLTPIPPTHTYKAYSPNNAASHSIAPV
jgi:hypothetical protein